MLVMGADASLELRGEVKAEHVHTQYKQESQLSEISVVA